MSSIPLLRFTDSVNFLYIVAPEQAADLSGGDISEKTADLPSVYDYSESDPETMHVYALSERNNFLWVGGYPSSNGIILEMNYNSSRERRSGIITIYTGIDLESEPDECPEWLQRSKENPYPYREKRVLHSGESWRWYVSSNVLCLITFRETPADTNLTIVNVMDPLNYWIDKVKLNTEVTTVGALRNVLLAKQNGAKVMTLGGLRQAVDDNHGVRYTSIADMVFSTAYKSDGVSDFTGNQKSWFATDCAVAVAPARRPGWETANRKKFDISKITDLVDGNKYLSDYNVGEHGFIIVDWQSGPRKKQGMDWSDAGIDIVFDYLGDVL